MGQRRVSVLLCFAAMAAHENDPAGPSHSLHWPQGSDAFFRLIGGDATAGKFALTALSLRRVWSIYKRTAIAQGSGASKRDRALSQVAFSAGGGVLKLLDHMIAEGDYEALQAPLHSTRIQM
jgi:hypothetical protein